MTHVGSRFGLRSLLCGVIACLLFAALSHLARLGQLAGGNILRAFDQFGLVSKERTYIVEMKASSVFALNDGNAIIWLTWIAFALALLAIAFALYAEHKREATLYPSSGFIVGAMSLGLMHP